MPKQKPSRTETRHTACSIAVSSPRDRDRDAARELRAERATEQGQASARGLGMNKEEATALFRRMTQAQAVQDLPIPVRACHGMPCAWRWVADTCIQRKMQNFRVWSFFIQLI